MIRLKKIFLFIFFALSTHAMEKVKRFRPESFVDVFTSKKNCAEEKNNLQEYAEKILESYPFNDSRLKNQMINDLTDCLESFVRNAQKKVEMCRLYPNKLGLTLIVRKTNDNFLSAELHKISEGHSKVLSMVELYSLQSDESHLKGAQVLATGEFSAAEFSILKKIKNLSPDQNIGLTEVLAIDEGVGLSVYFPFYLKITDVYMRREGGKNLKILIRWLKECTEGLKTLHNTLKFTHNEIKVDHLMIDRKDHCRLVDFGAAKKVGEEQTCGTKKFCAPEVINKEKNIDYKKSDLYSLAYTFWLLYSGRADSAGRASLVDPHVNLENEIDQKIQRTSDEKEKNFLELLKKAVKNDPKERIDVKKFLAELEKIYT